jgi:exonuclease SbcC
MIPLHLTLSGFLSYQAPIELDFTCFNLACISGPNGAGKSSLLDAITWALFGQARKRDEAIINAQSKSAEVRLEFSYEDNIYRVQRSLPRGKTTTLEFQIRQKGEDGAPAGWKALTERTLRETQARIEQVLRLDYETFVNASFFLQGKADQFTQQRPGDRKRILSTILGLEIWDIYRQRALERRRILEGRIAALDGRLSDIQVELGEEDQRRARLGVLETDLERHTGLRLSQEAALENARKVANTLAEQSRLVDNLARQLENAARRLEESRGRLASRQEEREAFARMVNQDNEIRAAYAAWQQARSELETWEGVAVQFREHEKRRQAPLDEINAARARLFQEQQTLLGQQAQVETLVGERKGREEELVTVQKELTEAEEQLTRRAQMDLELQSARQRLAEARAENPRLKAEMDELKERINRLEETEGANCPLCGQPLSPQERFNLIEELTTQGKGLGDRFRANRSLLEQADSNVSAIEKEISQLGEAEPAARRYAASLAQVTARLDFIKSQVEAWQAQGAPRLQEITQILHDESYASAARLRLSEIDAELKAIGYDAAAHDTVRRSEVEGRQSETRLRELEKAQAALAPLERETAELAAQISLQQEDCERQQGEYTSAAASLASARAQAPDVLTAERELMTLTERENRLRMEVGAARQKVEVLEDLKVRRKNLENQREELARQVSRYKQLERAFGKDGVPALLIEQALPEIEGKANEILDRLSGGNMSVRFISQTPFKDKRREDLKETLEIQISDGAGTREYELFSGGEAFRVNFAVRLALSEVLAQRAGARLQTLVIDEGFGSQDAMGRQRLIEAINQVAPDFSKILVITHIDELKDAFPTRIEVEKTPDGSTLTII